MRIDEIIVITVILLIMCILGVAICYGMYMRMKEQQETEKYTIDIRENPNTIVISIKEPIQAYDGCPV